MGIIKRIFKKKEPTPQLGGKLYTPAEAMERGGGFVSTSDPNVPGAYQGRIVEGVRVDTTAGQLVPGTITPRTIGGGGGSSYIPPTISQPQLQSLTPEQKAQVQARQTQPQQIQTKPPQQITGVIKPSVGEQQRTGIIKQITQKRIVQEEKKRQQLGGVFLKKEEVLKYPQGTPSDAITQNELRMQQSIETSEEILNIPKGSSGAGYIPEALVSRQAPPLRERGGFVGGVAVTTENIITGIEGSKAYQTVLGTREEPTRARTFLFGTGMFPEGSKVYAGSVPFIPAGSFGGVQNIKFIGTQKALKGGDISTDVLFKVKSRVGIARGVTRTGEEISQTVVAGRTGILGVKFPTASVKGGRITSFVSRGFSKESQVGEYTKSVGVAQSASARRTKLINTAIEFPTGRLMKKPALSLFKDLSISKSFALQDENIIKIVGVSKSVRGSRATYQGIIRVVDTGEEGFKGYTFLGRGGKGFRQPTQAQRQASAKDVASQIAGAVIKTPSTTLQKATSISSVGLNKVQPLSFKGSITSNIVLEKKAQQGIITSVSPKAISTNQNIKFVDLTLIKQPSVSRTQQETSQIQKSYLQTIQIPREMQVTKTLQAQKTLQVQKQVPLLVSKYKQTQVSRLVIPLRLPQIKIGKPFGLPLKIKPSAKDSGGFFTISERRFGVFRPIGKATDLGKAFNIGVGQTGRTLGASYKVQDIFGKTYAGPSKNYYTKMEKGGIVNIQRRSKRLSSLSERQAIQTAKRLTKGSKKKKKRGGKSLW